ncbi:hypothetical protein CR513_34386, partial [Mucuna pruriens]
MLIYFSCLERVCSEAFFTVVYVINCLSSFVLSNVSPYEHLYHTSPNYNTFCVFGCTYFILLYTPSLSLVLIYVIFLDMVLNIKVIVVEILLLKELMSLTIAPNEVALPQRLGFYGCKRVSKIKNQSNCYVERYKARLDSKGRHLPHVAYISLAHTLLATIAIKKWTLREMDVKNSFLNGDMEEDVYM